MSPSWPHKLPTRLPGYLHVKIALWEGGGRRCEEGTGEVCIPERNSHPSVWCKELLGHWECFSRWRSKSRFGCLCLPHSSLVFSGCSLNGSGHGPRQQFDPRLIDWMQRNQRASYTEHKIGLLHHVPRHKQQQKKSVFSRPATQTSACDRELKMLTIRVKLVSIACLWSTLWTSIVAWGPTALSGS